MKHQFLLNLTLFFLIITLSSVGNAQELVKITQSKSGKSVDVVVVEVKSSVLTFKTPQGKNFSIALSELTPDSVQRLKDHLSKNSSAPSPTSTVAAPTGKVLEMVPKLNEVIGHELFSGKSSLFQEDAAEVASRLKWKQESRKENSSSYRTYTDLEYVFLGAHPYCATLYGGDGGRPERISLVFANKGDFGSRLGMGPDHFKKIHPDKVMPGNLEDAIKLDEEVVRETLTRTLGEPTIQYYGEKEDKRKVKRWDFGDQSFILSSLEGEYTNLLIVPKPDADLEGKAGRVLDSEFRKIQLTNVKRESNGDVWVNNIPMVDQGPKGYCAPATFERAMRYMGIPADMYLLATAATAVGGGTNTTKLSEDCKNIARSKARKIKELELDKDLKIKELKKYIDKGVPVLWQMRSLETYNELATSRTDKRESVTDYKAWAQEIQAEAESMVGKLKVDNNHHICMIIGYNEATREVAVSDSWGPRFELRWVHEEIAKAVTSSGGFVIDI